MPMLKTDDGVQLHYEEAGRGTPVVFVHGTASFRTQSLTQMTHWASRGFVVLAADHPKIRLKDLLANLGG